MDFRAELTQGISTFLSMIHKDNETDILLMPYAEFTLQCYIIYHDALSKDLLHEDAPLAKAFCELGIDQPRDQLLIFLDALYLYWHTQETSFQ